MLADEIIRRAEDILNEFGQDEDARGSNVTPQEHKQHLIAELLYWILITQLDTQRKLENVNTMSKWCPKL